jgi:DNA-binding response OmpR family regulator
MNTKRSILLVDDDEVALYMARGILDGAGYDVVIATSALLGVELGRALSPHLVVLDLMMPKHSGFRFLEEWRVLPEGASIPVIVLSGMRDKASVVKAISLGAKDYVTKPIEARALLGKVSKLMKDQNTPSFVFAKNSRPRIRAQVPGRILQGNEIGFLLEAPVKLAPRSDARIESELLNELGCSTAVLRKTETPAWGGFPGQYINEIGAVGLGTHTAQRIRRLMRSWL